MSASLVGSEMCIRDRPLSVREKAVGHKPRSLAQLAHRPRRNLWSPDNRRRGRARLLRASGLRRPEGGSRLPPK
eukprot:903631-Alexandrium_andersonii.AAC.1